MGYYSSQFDKYGSLNTANLIQIIREDANNFLVYLPIPGETNTNIRARWRLKIISTAWHLAGLSIVDLNGTASTINLSDAASAIEYAMRLGKSGDLEASFTFVGSIHGFETSISAALTIDGKTITSLATGKSAWGVSAVMTQAIDLLYPGDGTTVLGRTTLTHTMTSTQIQMDASHAFNNAQAWESFTHYGCMLPALNTGCDKYQVQGFSVAAIVSDGNWKESGTQATWAEFSAAAHNYRMRATMPTGGPNLAGSWANSDPLLAGVQDRVDGIAKFYAFNITSAFANRVSVANTTIASRSVYTADKS